MFKAMINAMKIQSVFLIYSIWRAKDKLLSGDTDKLKETIKRLFIKYAKAVATISGGSGICYLVFCFYTNMIPNLKVNSRFFPTSSFVISALSWFLEDTAKMPTYMGFYMPKVLETVSNLLR
jgi:hypothetical protein